MFGQLINTFDAVQYLQNEMEKATSSNFFGSSTCAGGCNPPVNVFEQGDDVIVLVEMPGVKKEDVKIEIKHDQLKVSGSRALDYSEKVSVHRRERRNFDYDRTIQLPVVVDADKVDAKYENGILHVVLPRAESDKPRKIMVS